MRPIILYFGSFNPIHNGHIALARSVLEKGFGKEVRFVLSPQNPFKRQQDLWPENLRRQLLEEAIAPFPEMRFCDAELQLPKPSYTIRTLEFLQREFPEEDFAILMGEDNLQNLHRWKDYEKILRQCRILVYPRQENPSPNTSCLRPTERSDSRKIASSPALHDFSERIQILDLPLLDISSSSIREALRKGSDISALVPFDPKNYDLPR